MRCVGYNVHPENRNYNHDHSNPPNFTAAGEARHGVPWKLRRRGMSMKKKYIRWGEGVHSAFIHRHQSPPFVEGSKAPGVVLWDGRQLVVRSAKFRQGHQAPEGVATTRSPGSRDNPFEMGDVQIDDGVPRGCTKLVAQHESALRGWIHGGKRRGTAGR